MNRSVLYIVYSFLEMKSRNYDKKDAENQKHACTRTVQVVLFAPDENIQTSFNFLTILFFNYNDNLIRIRAKNRNAMR